MVCPLTHFLYRKLNTGICSVCLKYGTRSGMPCVKFESDAIGSKSNWPKKFVY